MIFDQCEYNVRSEWGERGVRGLAPASDAVIIVDVLSFSTAVEVATSQGATVFPYRWKDETADEYAKSVNAEVADKRNRHNRSLSPASLLNLPSGTRLVLPSPNGSTLSLLAGSTPVLLGCLRNCEAVARSALKFGSHVAVIPAGERWDDGSLRPCFEDLVGAGAVISFLQGTLSPEALAARSAFERACENLHEYLRACSSGKEKIARHEEQDVKLASALNASSCVPLLTNGAFLKEA